MMNIPKDLQYAETHEWVKLEDNKEDNVVTVGISDFAQDALGDIVFVELPTVGDTFDQGEAVAVVESVKTASDIYAPVAGKITAINEALETTPESINESPYEDGWLFKLHVDDGVNKEHLLDAAGYEAVVEAES